MGEGRKRGREEGRKEGREDEMFMINIEVNIVSIHVHTTINN
jgi:predicted transposase YdaD